MRRSLHREPSDNLLGELQNVRSLLTVGLLFCSEGQVQEEMKKLKIINRSGMAIQLTELISGIQLEETISIAPDEERNYKCDRDFHDRRICLDLPLQYPINRPRIFLHGDFIDANKIAYVRKGDGNRWFVDPVHRAAKLVRKHVYNSTVSPIALVECVLEQIGETRRVPGTMDAARWTAWSEITVRSRTKHMLIVDPVAVEKGNRRYFVRRGGGPPLFGSIDDVMLRQQNNNVNGNICEIKMRQSNEYVEVKENSHGMLESTSSWRPPFLVLTKKFQLAISRGVLLNKLYESPNWSWIPTTWNPTIGCGILVCVSRCSNVCCKAFLQD
jgi:hypothetical protein